MSYDRVERIRRAAILVASLEEKLAKQMLASLPQAEAAKVLAEIERLDDVDDEEQQDVLEEFRRAGRIAQSRHEAVEFTYSAPRSVMPSPEKPADDPAAQCPSSAELETEAAVIAELLAPEHPQTIAAALSRLGQEQAAAAFAALPASLQADVVERLANLQIADEDAVRELEIQLLRRIDEQRARRQRMAASIELAKRMLAKTAPQQRETLLARISPRLKPSLSPLEPSALPSDLVEAILASPVGEVAASEPAMEADEIRTAIGLAQETLDDGALESKYAWEACVEDAINVDSGSQSEPADTEWELDNHSVELEHLSDGELFAALQVADEQTVRRALAASSETLLNRVASRLPRRQAVRLRSLVHSIGPTRLTELRDAQQQLLRLGRMARQLANTP